MTSPLPLSFAVETLTRVRPSITSDHGTRVPDWSVTDDVDIEGCFSHPGPSGEDNERRDANRINRTAYLPGGSDFRSTDGIRRPAEPGVLYRTEGYPDEWEFPVSDVRYLVVELVRWEG